MRSNKQYKQYKKILKKFPKKRLVLNKMYKNIYKQHYINNRGGAGISNFLSQFMESWMHKKVSSISSRNILELGAGNLNHIKYEKDYSNYDIVEPFIDLYKNSLDLPIVRNNFSSLSDVKLKYDKIISIATLEHLENLPKVIELCKQLLNKNGIFQVAIPCEGEFAFKLGWKITTGIAFRLKHKLNYSRIMEYEHLNNLEEIKIILENNFKITKFERSPFILPIKNLSFYAYFECKII